MASLFAPFVLIARKKRAGQPGPPIVIARLLRPQTADFVLRRAAVPCVGPRVVKLLLHRIPGVHVIVAHEAAAEAVVEGIGLDIADLQIRPTELLHLLSRRAKGTVVDVCGVKAAIEPCRADQPRAAYVDPREELVMGVAVRRYADRFAP